MLGAAARGAASSDRVGSIGRISTRFVKLCSTVVKRARASPGTNTEHRYLTPAGTPHNDGMMVRVWEYDVPETSRAEFERTYGPAGDWVQLLSSSNGSARRAVRVAEPQSLLDVDCFPQQCLARVLTDVATPTHLSTQPPVLTTNGASSQRRGRLSRAPDRAGGWAPGRDRRLTRYLTATAPGTTTPGATGGRARRQAGRSGPRRLFPAIWGTLGLDLRHGRVQPPAHPSVRRVRRFGGSGFGVCLRRRRRRRAPGAYCERSLSGAGAPLGASCCPASSTSCRRRLLITAGAGLVGLADQSLDARWSDFS